MLEKLITRTEKLRWLGFLNVLKRKREKRTCIGLE